MMNPIVTDTVPMTAGFTTGKMTMKPRTHLLIISPTSAQSHEILYNRLARRRCDEPSEQGTAEQVLICIARNMKGCAVPRPNKHICRCADRHPAHFPKKHTARYPREGCPRETNQRASQRTGRLPRNGSQGNDPPRNRRSKKPGQPVYEQVFQCFTQRTDRLFNESTNWHRKVHRHKYGNSRPEGKRKNLLGKTPAAHPL